ncbi:MAG: type II secretion system protein [Desulfuromonadaceae bacterium]|nr:type II secretion system protein [Desulfuromonadaceae bacterium]
MADRVNRNSFSRQGFTLVELAIVLVIVGLLVGVGSSMMGMLTTAIKVREAKDNVEAALQSVTSWASANNRVPPLTATPPDTATFALSAASTKDSWGRDLIYLYDNNLATYPPTKDTICGRRSTKLTIVRTDPPGTIDNVAFIVISKSDDAAVDTNMTGTLYNPGANSLANQIIPGSGYVSAAATVTLDPNVRDIVRWVTLDELRSKVACQGAPLKIVNNELPFANVGAPYSATIFPDGGVPPYQWCVQYTSATLPGGIAATPSVVSTNCSAFTYLAAATVLLAPPVASPNITTGSQGSYSIIVNVKDADNNTAQKPFVLTINPN